MSVLYWCLLHKGTDVCVFMLRWLPQTVQLVLMGGWTLPKTHLQWCLPHFLQCPRHERLVDTYSLHDGTKKNHSSDPIPSWCQGRQVQGQGRDRDLQVQEGWFSSQRQLWERSLIALFQEHSVMETFTCQMSFTVWQIFFILANLKHTGQFLPPPSPFCFLLFKHP